MVPAVRSVLVVGAGAAGCATAVRLASGGVQVDLVDRRDAAPEVGSGITLQGNALRVLRGLGVWPQVHDAGYGFDSLGIRLPDPAATLVVDMPDVRTGGPDLPATLGLPRPVLTRILLDRCEEVGVKVRWGAGVVDVADAGGVPGAPAGVEAVFEDGDRRRYDLVVAADGAHSRLRRAVGVDADPLRTGMGIWRVFVPRPDGVTRTELTYGGRCHIAGYCPTGQDSLYAYVVEDAQDRGELTTAQQLDVVRELAADYHGHWDAIRESLDEATHVNHAWFETHLVPRPWHRGRVVLVGDAAHSCPPTVAQGAALALEDADVLAELLLDGGAGSDLDELLRAYTERRFERARTVVEASVQIGRWMLERTPREQTDVPGLMRRVTELVAVPA